jgi:hypothetical protein
MAYKGKHVLCNSTLDFNTKLKDFLVDECGWIHDPASPTIDLTARTAQDDKHGFILGWFLKSNGEDGNQNIPMHIGWGTFASATSSKWWKGYTSYLAAGINSSDTSISLTTAFTTLASGNIIQIGDELIQVGVVDGTLLSVCIRGMYGTTAVSHSVKDVIARVTDSAPAITMHAVRDLANPILTSGTNLGSMGLTASSGNITMTDTALHATRDDNKYNYCTLVKAAGQWRWVHTQTVEATGTIAIGYDAYYTPPGNVPIEIFSAGFHPHASRHCTPEDAGRWSPIFSSCTMASPKDCWFYGSKDGIAVVILIANNAYRIFYNGKYTPYCNPTFTTAASVSSGDIARGATQIKVADVTKFAIGGKYMLLTNQPAVDWAANRNTSTSTYMNASTDNWPNLDGNEAVFEYVIVAAIDVGTSVLTLTVPTCYSYKAGALIGEHIRPHVGYCQSYDAVSNNQQFSAAGDASAVCFHSARNEYIYTNFPAHRIRWRCCSANNFIPAGSLKPWEGHGANSYYGAKEKCDQVIRIGDPDYYPEAYSGAVFLTPYMLRPMTDSDWKAGGGDNTRKPGYIPHVRKVNNIWSAVSEDTIKVQFAGSYETFRLFYNDWAGYWFAMGPEIA